MLKILEVANTGINYNVLDLIEAFGIPDGKILRINQIWALNKTGADYVFFTYNNLPESALQIATSDVNTAYIGASAAGETVNFNPDKPMDVYRRLQIDPVANTWIFTFEYETIKGKLDFSDVMGDLESEKSQLHREITAGHFGYKVGDSGIYDQVKID